MESFKLKNIGWVSKIQKRRHTYFFSIAKLIATGSLLKNGDKLYSYVSEYQGRNVIITYLDGMPRRKENKPETLEYNAFIEG